MDGVKANPRHSSAVPGPNLSFLHLYNGSGSHLYVSSSLSLQHQYAALMPLPTDRGPRATAMVSVLCPHFYGSIT